MRVSGGMPENKQRELERDPANAPRAASPREGGFGEVPTLLGASPRCRPSGRSRCRTSHANSNSSVFAYHRFDTRRGVILMV